MTNDETGAQKILRHSRNAGRSVVGNKATWTLALRIFGMVSLGALGLLWSVAKLGGEAWLEQRVRPIATAAAQEVAEKAVDRVRREELTTLDRGQRYNTRIIRQVHQEQRTDRTLLCGIAGKTGSQCPEVQPLPEPPLEVNQ